MTPMKNYKSIIEKLIERAMWECALGTDSRPIRSFFTKQYKGRHKYLTKF